MTLSWLSQGEADVPRGLQWLAASERERLERMRFRKRRDDYLLGRWTAKRALALGGALPQAPESLARLEIRHAEGGAPLAFAAGERLPLEISISDRAGQGACALAPAGLAVGCDLEVVEPRSRAFVDDYLTSAERAVVSAAASERERDLLANLFWSAKESALKVLGTGLRRDTRSVEIELLAGPETGGWRRLLARTEEGERFPGWWRPFGAFVLTLAAAGETGVPSCLLEPPGLAAAAPSESWREAPV